MKFDYIILGAGSAGSVLAHRLSNSGKKLRIALVEAGKADYGRLNSWQIRMPAALTYSVGSDEYNWNFYTTRQKNMNNRRLHAPRGKVYGGSSSINAMVYARGHKEDFDRWAKEGAEGWEYSNILPYFLKAQGDIVKSDFKGSDGPLQTKHYPYGQRNNILFDVFEDGGVELGYPRSKDLNGYKQEGFGPFDMTVDPYGARSSTSRAYLEPLLREKSDRFQLFGETVVQKINFDANKTAKSVTCRTKTGEEIVLEANNEIIVSLGAVGSPHLLKISGIGASEELNKFGIEPIVDNKHVGMNLQDHLEIYLQYLCKDDKKVSIYPVAAWDFGNPFNLLKRSQIGLKWFLAGKGICSSNLFESGGFIRSCESKLHPDIQFHFVPAIINGQLDVVKKHGFQIHAGTLRPSSRGNITLQSNNIQDTPLIDPNYLSTEEDFKDLRAAIRLGDSITNTKAFSSFKNCKYDSFNDIDLMNDNELDNWIKEFAESAYHLSCTCSMGKVVDKDGKVFGVNGLRIVDASIMPSMTSGNLNSPTVMLSEKISDNILGYPYLKPIQLKIFNSKQINQ